MNNLSACNHQMQKPNKKQISSHRILFIRGLSDLIKSDKEIDEEINERKDIFLYLRFDESNPEKTITYSNANAIPIIHDPKTFIGPLLDCDPMEIEDSWGKKYSNAYALVLPDDGIKVAFKESEWAQTFSICFWCKSESSFIQLFKIRRRSSEDVCILKDNRIIFNDTTLMKEVTESFEKWNHFCFTYSSIGVFRVYINSKALVEANVKIESIWKATELLILQERVQATEVLIWKKCLNAMHVKQNMRTPLSILSELMPEFKMQIKKTNATKPKKIGIAKIKMI